MQVNISQSEVVDLSAIFEILLNTRHALKLSALNAPVYRLPLAASGKRLVFAMSRLKMNVANDTNLKLELTCTITTETSLFRKTR